MKDVSLIVLHHGLPRLMLSERLLYQQNAWKNVEKIKTAHELRLVIEELMSETRNVNMLRSLRDDWTEIQFELQRLWGFEEGDRFHKFWTLPKCTCPKMDNEDYYYIYPDRSLINPSCPLHGDD